MRNDKTHLLALDQGTSSSRSIVFDARGRIVAMAQRELRQIYPRPGWVEHDPKEIWTTQLATAREEVGMNVGFSDGHDSHRLVGCGLNVLIDASVRVDNQRLAGHIATD